MHYAELHLIIKPTLCYMKIYSISVLTTLSPTLI